MIAPLHMGKGTRPERDTFLKMNLNIPVLAFNPILCSRLSPGFCSSTLTPTFRFLLAA